MCWDHRCGSTIVAPKHKVDTPQQAAIIPLECVEFTCRLLIVVKLQTDQIKNSNIIIQQNYYVMQHKYQLYTLFLRKMCSSECRDEKLRRRRLFAQKLTNPVHARSCATRPSHWCYANNKLGRVGYVFNSPIPITFINNKYHRHCHNYAT